jgi:hypothetical protein
MNNCLRNKNIARRLSLELKSTNPVGLKKIECSLPRPKDDIVLRLLAIEEEMDCNKINICKYKIITCNYINGCNSCNNIHSALKCYVCKKIAHFYVKTNNPNASYKNHVIVFVKMSFRGRREELVTILCNTAEQQKIAEARTCFHVIYYEKGSISYFNKRQYEEPLIDLLSEKMPYYATNRRFCYCHIAPKDNPEIIKIDFDNGGALFFDFPDPIP